MSYQVKPGDIFGRIGQGLGRGLSEQIPKEMERYRLAEGLRNFEENVQNLTPMQQLARLSSIPGITPQMIQSFSDLAKIQNLGRAFGQTGQAGMQGQPVYKEQQPEPSRYEGVSPTDQATKVFGKKPEKLTERSAIYRDISPKTEVVNPTAFGQEQIQGQPEISPKGEIRARWEPEQRNQRISEYINKGFLPDKAQELAADDERRYLEAPLKYEANIERLQKKSEQARAELLRQLQTKLQTDEKGLFKDITGEMLINLERSMERDLIQNPNSTFKDVANQWSNKALDLAKTKTQLNKTLETTGMEALFKGKTPLNKLKEYSKIFKQTGNSEEYKNILQSWGMSPQGAASIAYQPSKNLENYIDKLKIPKFHQLQTSIESSDYSKKLAKDVEDFIRKGDSILSIAQNLSYKIPNFDETAFFEQLSEDRNQLSLSPLQERELAEGPKDWTPHWGDILILPIIRQLFEKEKKENETR